MKKFIRTSFAFAGAFILALLMANPVKAQSASSKESEFPPDVNKVIQTSCFHCHMSPGNAMAMTHVNLSKWAEYSPDKQAKKAAAMAKMVSKGKMPPKGFRKDNPNDVPTEADIKAIKDWADSLNSASK